MDHSCPAPLQIGRRTVMRRPFSTLYVPPYFTLTDIFEVCGGIVGVWIPAAFIKCRIPRSGALFEDQTGCEKGKNNIQNLVRRFVGFVNHQTGAFLLPGEFKRGVFNLLLEMYDCAPDFIGTAKKGTHFFIRFAE